MHKVKYALSQIKSLVEPLELPEIYTCKTLPEAYHKFSQVLLSHKYSTELLMLKSNAVKWSRKSCNQEMYIPGTITTMPTDPITDHSPFNPT